MSGTGMARAAQKKRIVTVYLCLAAVLAAAILIAIGTGSVAMPAGRVARIILFGEGSPEERSILWKIRLPRVLMGVILGGALSLSGFLLQTFFANPIAGPFVLGISSGAKLTVAMVMIFFLGTSGHVSSWTLVAASFAGALAVTGIILAVSPRVQSMAGLLVAGIMVGYICSAVTDFLITFADDADIVNLTGWSQGSFSGMNWGNVRAALAVVLVCFLAALLLSKQIGAYQLGEAYAQSMGVNVRVFRVLLVLLSCILSAVVTAFAGPVSFVGIAVPFLIRQALGTSRPLPVIPAVFMGGSLFCVICDLIARTAMAPTELRVSAVTSLLGAPVVLYMLMGRGRHSRRGLSAKEDR